MLRYETIFILVLHCCCNVKARINENDEILAEIIPTTNQKQRRNQVNEYIQSNKPNNQYQNLNGISTINVPVSTTIKDGAFSGKNDAYSIASDVDKYGLYEYTSDNTGMADQLRKLINIVHHGDENGMSQDHILENQANQMNAKINRYIESSMDTRPTIDPLESPIGFNSVSPTVAPIVNSQNSDVAVITIPNSMTIEDEHGREIDTIKEDKWLNENTIKENYSADLQPAKNVSVDLLKETANFASPPTVTNREQPRPTVSLIHHDPTTSLTFKLYKALKTNKNFLKNAQKLLSGMQENELNTFEKNKSVLDLIKDPLSTELKQSYSTKVNDIRHDENLRHESKGLIDNTNIRLFKVIKKLFNNQAEPNTERDSKPSQKKLFNHAEVFNQQRKVELEPDSKSNAKVRLTISKEISENQEVNSINGNSQNGNLQSGLSKAEESQNEDRDRYEETLLVKNKSEKEINQQLLNEIKKLLKNESVETSQDEDSNHEEKEEEKLGTNVYDFLKNTDELKTFLIKNTNGKSNSEWIKKFSKLGTEFPPNPVKESNFTFANSNSNIAKIDEKTNTKTNFINEGNTKDAAINDNEIKQDNERLDEELNEIERQKELLKEKEKKLQKLKEEIKNKQTKINYKIKNKEIKDKEKSDSNQKIKQNTNESREKNLKQVSSLLDSHTNVQHTNAQQGVLNNEEQQYLRKKLLRKSRLNLKKYDSENTEKTKNKHSKLIFTSERRTSDSSFDSAKQNSLKLPINNPKPSLSDSFVPHAKFYNDNDKANEPNNVIKESSNDVQEKPLFFLKKFDSNLENSWISNRHNLISSESTDALGETKDFILTTTKENKNDKSKELNKNMNEQGKASLISPSNPIIRNNTQYISTYNRVSDKSSERRKLSENQSLLNFASLRIPQDRNFTTIDDKTIKTDEDISRKRFIKPISINKMVDVAAYKKSFSETPDNLDINEDTPELSLKEKVNETLHSEEPANYTMELKPNLTSVSEDNTNKTESQLYKPIIPQHAVFKKKKHSRKFHHLTPRVMKHFTPLINERNVIVPDLTYKKFTDNAWFKDEENDDTDPADITRSILPKVDFHFRKNISNKIPIEAAFDIIGSDNNRRDSILNIPVEIVRDPIEVLKNNKKIHIEIIKTFPNLLRKIDKPLEANNDRDKIILFNLTNTKDIKTNN